MMHRFFIAPQDINGLEALLDDHESRHALQVMRLGMGDEVILFDGQGKSYLAVLEGKQGRRVQTRLKEALGVDPLPVVYIHLVQGLPKGDKMETIIQKAVEIGVHSLHPLQCRRSVAQLKGDAVVKKLQRWDSIAREACKQSGRSRLMQIQPSSGLQQLLHSMQGASAVVLYEKEQQLSYREVLRHLIPKCLNRELFILVGPEGGWDEGEIEEMTAAGVCCASLGRGILRTETAALIASALALYEAGELGSIQLREEQ